MKWNQMKYSQWVISSLILFGALVVIFLLYFTRPEPPKTEPEEVASLVEVMPAVLANERVIITAFGTVLQNREVQIHPEVTGRVIEKSDELTPGGIFSEGEVMLRIDPRDYLAIVEQEKANVSAAFLKLKEEEGKQVVAKREWNLLKETVPQGELAEYLSLRKPHLEEKKAALESAKARLRKAEIDLERTVIRAPFDAIVTVEAAEIGQVVTQLNPIATLVSTEMFRVQLSVPFDKLQWIAIPQNGSGKGAKVKVIQEGGQKNRIEREGYVIRILGDVDPNSRLVRVVAGVMDPLCLDKKTSCNQPLLLESYVRGDIEGPLMSHVIRVPRRAVREGDIVWVMDSNKRLRKKKVQVDLKREDDVLVSKGLEEGDLIILNALPLALEGMKLRLVEDNG